MNELITNKYIMTSRDLAELMEKQHSHVMRDIKDEMEKLEQQGIEHQSKCGEIFLDDAYGRKQPAFGLTKEGAMQMATRYDAKIRHEVITYINKLEQQIRIPMTYAEALRQLADEIETKEQLQLENQRMKPKEEFFDAVTESKDAVDIGTLSKVIGGIGRNTLFQLLRDKEVLMTNNIPYQTFIDRGWFRVIEQKYTKSDGTTCINFKTLVYQKGVNKIIHLIKEAKNEAN